MSEQTPSAQSYAADFPMFRQIGRTGASRYTPTVRSDKYGRVFIYSPDIITFQEYDEMRMDGQMRAGLWLIKLPIMQSPWSISCQTQDIANFCTEVLKPIWHDFIRQA